MSKIVAGAGANLLSQHAKERNSDATVYVGNLDPQVTEDILWELFTQVARVHNVYIPRDHITNTHSAFGFVELKDEASVPYAINVLNNTRLFGRVVRMNKASQSQKNEADVGAHLFVGHLSRNVDASVLDSIFSRFGRIIHLTIHHNPEDETKLSYAFVHYDCFEASDEAIRAMDGQFIENQQITVSYARKKDANGELHGSPAERELAKANPDRKPYVPPPPQPPQAATAAAAGSYYAYGNGNYAAAPPPPGGQMPYQVGADGYYHVAPAPPPAVPPPPPHPAGAALLPTPRPAAWYPQQPWAPPPPPPAM